MAVTVTPQEFTFVSFDAGAIAVHDVSLTVRAGEVQGSAQALGGLEPWRVALATGLSIEEVAA